MFGPKSVWQNVGILCVVPNQFGEMQEFYVWSKVTLAKCMNFMFGPKSVWQNVGILYLVECQFGKM